MNSSRERFERARQYELLLQNLRTRVVAQRLDSIDFPLEGGHFALHSKLLKGAYAAHNGIWGRRFGSNAGNELRLHSI